MFRFRIKSYSNYFYFTIDYHKNFHHFITEMAFQLHWYYKIYKNIKILIKPNKFVYEYLNLLSFIDTSKIEFMEENKLYYFNNLVVNKSPIKTKKCLQYFLNNNFYIKYKNNTITYYPDRIFLYRNNDKRKLNNIEEFISIAKENNFYIYSPEDDCLENQIKLVSNCKILMCELGAGCCNMFFTNNKCKINHNNIYITASNLIF